MPQKSIIPIKPYGPPKEGRRSLQYEIDLSNGSAVVDLTAVAMQGQISQVPMLFCDNADNDIAVSIIMEGTLQRIVVPANAQGYINLLLPQSPRVGFSCQGSIAKLNVNFLNFQVDELIWSVSQGMSGGTVTSVGLDAPAVFSVSGSPVTTAGDLTFEWFAVGAHTVLAGPTGGADTIPTFRHLVGADIPDLSGLYDIAGAAAAALVTAEAYTDAKIAALPAPPVGANPSATAGPAAVNGVAATFMRSDAAPLIQKGTAAQFGIVQADGTTITSAAGVLSAIAALPATGFFLAQLTTNQNVVNNTFTKCIFDAFVSNTLGTQYNVANGRFTPTRAGNYLLWSSGRGGPVGGGSVLDITISLTKNGTWPSTGTQVSFAIENTPAGIGNSDTPFAFSIVAMNGSGDWIESDMRVGSTVNGTLIGTQCFFGAMFVGA